MDDDANAPLDAEDIRAIAALSAADISAIDQAILAQLNHRWQKTAFVVTKAMYAYPDRYDDIADVFYGQRVIGLADAGLIETIGNLRQMRFSEIRLKCTGDTLG